MAYKLIGAIATRWHKILSYIRPNAITQLSKYVIGAELTKFNIIDIRVPGYNGNRYVIYFHCIYSKFNFVFTFRNKDKATILLTI